MLSNANKKYLINLISTNNYIIMSLKENNFQNLKVAYAGEATYNNADASSLIAVALNAPLYASDVILINNQAGLAQPPFISARTNAYDNNGAFTISAGVKTNTKVSYVILRKY